MGAAGPGRGGGGGGGGSGRGGKFKQVSSTEGGKKKIMTPC